MLAPDISEITARRERLGIRQTMPIVRGHIPPKVKPPKDYLRIAKPDEPKVAISAIPAKVHEREEEAAIVPLHRIAAERWKDIIKEVAEKHGITVTALLSRRRAFPIVHARQEACYRLVTELGLSYPATARRVNYYDHTTVIHAVKQHAARNGLELNRRVETEEYRQQRDAAIVRGMLVGKTAQELAEQYDLSVGRVHVIAKEQMKRLEAMNAQ